MSSSSEAIAPIDPARFSKANLRFSSCNWQKMADGTQYARTKIQYANPDAGGRLQDCVIKGGPSATYGVSDNKDSKTQEVTGHSVCIIPGTDARGVAFTKAMNEIHEASCEYLVKHNEECGQAMVTSMAVAQAFLKNPLAHPSKTTDNKKVLDPTKPKRMYAKLLEFKATPTRAAKMVSIFDDARSFDLATRKMTKTLDPLTVRSNVELIPSIQIDSIYFGSKPSIQIKLPRAVVTRELGGVQVAALDDDISEYMTNLGLTATAADGSASSGSGPIANPETLL